MLEKLWRLGVDVETVTVACMGLVVLLRLPEVLRPGQLRVLWVALGTATMAISLNLEPVTRTIFVATGPVHLSTLVRDLLGISSAVAVMHFMLRIAVRNRYALWLLYSAAGAVVAGLMAFGLTAPNHGARGAITACNPVPSTGYWIIIVLVHLAVDMSSVLLCCRYGRRSENLLLRLALRLFGLGGIFFVLLWAAATGYLLAQPPWLLAFFGILTGCGGLFMAAAVSVPLLQTVYARLVNLRSYWLLWPLWRDLVEAVPHVALVAPRSRLWDLLSGVHPLSLLLYRQVIEIRDAILVMADHAPPDVVRAAREHVDARGSQSATADAWVLACWIEVARRYGRDNSQGRCDLSTVAEYGGENLPAEVGFLLTVARTRRTELVRSFVEDAVGDVRAPKGRDQHPQPIGAAAKDHSTDS